MSQPHIHWLTENKQLNQAVALWQEQSWLTLDTEFMRTKTFWPIPGLIQVGVGDDVWLIDPLTISDWTAFTECLMNPGITKVMHAMSEDLELFRHLTGQLPVNVFDTQIAAAYAGLDFSMGYQRLIAELLDISVSKGETRSDWLARPLTQSQTNYAALDVFYLGKAYPKLVQALEGKGFSDWHREDCERQIQSVGTDTDPKQAWRDVKLSWKLNPQQLAVLQQLCYWRETQARERNLSRNRLAPAGALWDLARVQPKTPHDLRQIKTLKPQTIRQSGNEILMQVNKGQQVPKPDWPEPPAGPLPKRVQPCVDAIKKFCKHQAAELGLLPELIPSKVWTGSLLRGWLKTSEFTLPANVTGWRVEEVLKPMIQHLNSLNFQKHQ
ncbi:ribonuclease D [Parendozoicomonas sp. Alg238-R29]|uniref:ribonuclease D n=1 Tax=Parendozoicomonas sp. Alg238-R29 TaxID=2993446 RepID=UPI00248EC849|nr:ribonuclease D [Parendozoicomonas sp. Alg238-R29]